MSFYMTIERLGLVSKKGLPLSNRLDESYPIVIYIGKTSWILYYKSAVEQGFVDVRK